MCNYKYTFLLHRTNSYFWLGGKKRPDNTFEWNDGGMPVEWNAWYSGYPGVNSYMLAFSGGYWIGYNIYKWNYICETITTGNIFITFTYSYIFKHLVPLSYFWLEI